MFSSQSVEDFLSRLKDILGSKRETMTLTVSSISESTCLVAAYGGVHVAFTDAPCRNVIFAEFPHLVFSTFRDDLVVGKKAEMTVVLQKYGGEENRLQVE